MVWRVITETSDLMTPAEVDTVLRARHPAARRRDKDTQPRSVRTPGGSRRFWRTDVEAFLNRTPAGGTR